MRPDREASLWRQLWRRVQFESVLLVGLLVVTLVFGLSIARQLVVRRQVEQRYWEVAQAWAENYARVRELSRWQSVRGTPAYYSVWIRRYFHWGRPGTVVLPEAPSPPKTASSPGVGERSPWWWDEWAETFHIPLFLTNRAPR